MWLRPTRAEYAGGSCFNILVQSRFAAKWIDERFGNLIRETIAACSSSNWSFGYRVKPEDFQTEIFNVSERHAEKMRLPTANGNGSSGRYNSCLNPRYRLESFVVGDSNEFAYAACQAVAETPGVSRYNPLFVYGGVGLGKTHLAQAIGNAVQETDTDRRVLYVTSEQFTNEFIRALGNKTTHEFANRYRSADLLLVDDIQFFTGKESTQEQFFHTFNTLHQDGKQIVLTADRPPKEILGLEERLLSRFAWGLVADIKPPAFETRIAILQKKAAEDGVTIPPEMLAYIADSITSNVRQLEGALVKVLAYSSLRRKELTVALAQEALKDCIRHRTEPVTVETISKKVAGYFKLSEEAMKSKKKSQEIVNARQIAMYLCRTLTNTSLKLTGAHFGNRDHSTVIYACRQVEENIRSSNDFKLMIDQLIMLIYS